MMATRSDRSTPGRQLAGVLALLAAGAALLSCGDPTVPGGAQLFPDDPVHSHGDDFPVSTGIYRIPYPDGLLVRVTNDHHDHSPVNRIDMRVGEDTPIVAAAGGWIRAIVDHNGNRPNPGDGLDRNGDPQDDSLEHACVDLVAPDSSNIENSVVTGFCSHYNNYVWLEHPNGEWSKYSHFGTGTVRALGWDTAMWVDAGQVLGLENDVGRATGSHLHYEIAVPNDPSGPLTWTQFGGFIQNATNLVPRTCDIPNMLYVTGEDYTANECAHLPPTADAGGPYVVDEGTPLLLDGTGSNDPDGLPLTYRWSPDDNLDDRSLAQPTFVAGTSMVVDVTLTVYDQIEALADSATTTITVNNVDPTVTIDPDQVTVIDEEGTVTVVAEFTDPGFLDTHTATIDLGVPDDHPGIELAPASIQILDLGGPGQPLRGRVTGTYQYGDNDDGTGFTIEVTVTDSDGGVGSDSFVLTVNNVAPSVAIDPSGMVLLNGVPTVVAAIGEDVTLDSYALDPGSDDLALEWDWGDGAVDSRVSLVNPPAADPLPSPTVQPRNEPDHGTHAFVGACLYEVAFSATDDDGGQGVATADVIIVGLADQPRGAGYWTSEYRLVKNPDFTPATLGCYLDIANHASAVFSDHRPLGSLGDAVDVLWVRGTSDADDLLDRQILASWLNFANGAFGLGQLVDASGDGVADTPWLDVMEDAEALRTDPARTRAALLAMKDVLERLNGS
jgi:hypothetical protein